MPRLFQIDYLDDCDFETYLTVIEDDNLSISEIEKIEYDSLEEISSCLMTVSAVEIKEIDGHKIVVK